jgi:hypothetical protein
MTTETLDNTKKEADNGEIEAKAKAMGWRPESEFKGDLKEFVDAKTYVEKGEFVLPIVKKQRDEARKAQLATEQALQQVKTDLEQTKKDAQEAIKFMHQGLEREYKAKEAALKAEKAEAISAGDGAKAIAIESQIETLQAEKKEAKQEVKEQAKQETPQLHPDFQKWLDKNPWYATDKRLQRLAITLGFDMAEEDKSLEGLPLWNKVREELAQMYPDKFPEELEERPGAQRGGKSSSTNSKAKTYANLPEEARKACDKMVKAGYVKNQQQYLEMYDWSE